MKLLRDQTGSSLVTVLAMITIISTLVGTIMAVQLAQWRFIDADGDATQAQYTAEAGLYVALDELKTDPSWRPHQEVLPMPGDLTAQVSIEDFGAFILVVSSAHSGTREVTLRTMLGAATPAYFNKALVLFDKGARLNVAGSTRIIGDILTSQHEVRKNSFDGEPFSGKLEGEASTIEDLAPPAFNSRNLLEELSRLDSLNGATNGQPSSHASLLPSSNKIVFLSGDVHLSRADSTLLSVPITLIIEKDLIVEGPISLKPGSILISREKLHLQNDVKGHSILFYGKTGIDLSSAAGKGLQLLSRGSIEIKEHSYLEYPSLVLTTGEFADDAPSILLEEDVAVDGLVMYYPLTPPADDRMAHIQLSQDALVRGAVYNSGSTGLSGSIYGSLITKNTYFYSEPSHYTNWLLDSEIDLSQRPTPFVLPTGFGSSEQYQIISWETRHKRTSIIER